MSDTVYEMLYGNQGVEVKSPEGPRLVVDTVLTELQRLCSIESDYNSIIADRDSRDMDGYKLFDGNLEKLEEGTVLLANGTLLGGRQFKGCHVTVYSIRDAEGFGYTNTGFLTITRAGNPPTMQAVQKVSKNARILLEGGRA